MNKKPTLLKMAPAEPLAVDPVCHMQVAPSTAAGGHHDHDGVRYFFCGPSCRIRFAADPVKYVGGGGGRHEMHAHTAPEPPQAPPAPEGTVYFCPMDPEVRQPRPGS